MTARYEDHVLGLDIHANRPAATTVPKGATYSCSTHSLIYRSDGAAWQTWATLVGSSSTRVINAQTGTTYTAVLTDADRLAFLTMTNAAASTFTIPPNSSVAFPIGSVIEGAQLGAGQVTITQGAGVTINASPGLKIAAQYGTFGLLKTATDVWLAYGRLST